ncbi:MAG TPA: GNAT family N-acetyltransferase [Polyangiaceae bacterium]|nr:GNAT family N-acetyltransferase [Polyangiaceae bacterium]
MTDLISATSNDRPMLARLVQLYAYDFSEILGLDVGDDGLFHTGDLLAGCWSDPRRHAYVLRTHGCVAGFAIVDERSRLTGDFDVVDVAEFFVMRKYRRKGVGAACAATLFDLFPRRWEVRQKSANVAGTAFWRRVIERRTGGRFEEAVFDDERWRGPVQSFDVRIRA